MKNTTISNQSAPSIVSTQANTANVATPVFTMTVPDGARYTLANESVVQGAKINGALLIVALFNATGDRIRNGSLIVGYRAPAAEFVTQARSIPLTVWADLTTAQQKNAQYRGAIAQAADLNVGPWLTLNKRSKLVLSVESPEVVDWTKSYLEYIVTEENGE